VPEDVGDKTVFTIRFSDGPVAKIKLNDYINIKCGGVKTVPMDVCQGEIFSQEPKHQQNRKQNKMNN
jgi:hypothetical protein